MKDQQFQETVNKEFSKLLEQIDKSLESYKTEKGIEKPIYLEYLAAVKFNEENPLRFDTKIPDVINIIYSLAYKLAEATVVIKELKED